jgi:hypothetical protein
MRSFIGTLPELRQDPTEPPDEVAIGIFTLFVLVITMPYLLHR